MGDILNSFNMHRFIWEPQITLNNRNSPLKYFTVFLRTRNLQKDEEIVCTHRTKRATTTGTSGIFGVLPARKLFEKEVGTENELLIANFDEEKKQLQIGKKSEFLTEPLNSSSNRL